MALFERKQELSRESGKTPPPREKMPPPKEEKKDTSILGGKPCIPMEEAVRKIKKASPFIPGAGGAMYSEKERAEMAQEIVKKYGGFLEKQEIPKIIKDLEKKRWEAKTGTEKLTIDRKIRYLRREILGEGK